jgi:hypothetical protein
MLITYTLEILPYAIRAKGFALMVRHNPVILVPTITHLLPLKNLVVSLALALNQLVDPWAINLMGWKYVSFNPLVP